MQQQENTIITTTNDSLTVIIIMIITFDEGLTLKITLVIIYMTQKIVV